MLIPKDPKSEKVQQNNLDSAPEAPVQAHAMTPPPFQLHASPEGGLEESESEGAAVDLAGGEATQLHAAGDASEGTDDGGNGSGNGLPGGLKSSIETMSGQNLDDVKVNYNSSKPKEVGAHAYAQGNQIEVAPGQEKHLPEEAWHTVQQKEGRVQANTAVNGTPVNDDAGLEKEARDKGGEAAQMKADSASNGALTKSAASGPIQKNDDPNANPQVQTTGGPTVSPDLEAGEQATENVDVVVPKINIREGAAKVWGTIRSAVATALGVTVDALETKVFSVNLKFTFELGVEAEVLKGLFGVGGSGVFEASATLNQQDDRLIRAGWTLSYGGKLATQWLWLIETEHTWLQSFSRTSVYRDMAHFIGNMYQKISEFVDMLRRQTSRVEALPNEEWNGESRNWNALRNAAPTDVHSTTNSVNHSVGVGGVLTESGDAPVSGSYGTTDTDMHFYRGEGENRQVRNASQDTKTISGSLKVGWLDATLSFTETNIANHANEDNDGHYHNFNLTLNNPPYVKEFFDALGSRLSNMSSAVGSAIAPFRSAAGAAANFARMPEMFAAIKGLFNDALGAALNAIPADKLAAWQLRWARREVSTKSGFDSSLTVELNFVEFSQGSFSDMALQYVRISAGRSFSASFSAEVPLASFYGAIDVNMTTAGSFSAGASGSVLEIAGTNTLTYFITVYNGLVYTQSQVEQGLATDRFGRWNVYKTAHFLEIGQLIKNLGNPDSIAYKEAVHTHGLDPNSGLLAAARDVAQNGASNTQARAELDSFFEQNYNRKNQYAGSVASDAQDFQHQSDANGGRTPWSHVAGGSSRVFIDLANSTTPQVLRSDYSPQTQTPAQPNTIMDCLLQDQKVDTHLTIKYKNVRRVNEGTHRNKRYVTYTRALHESEFTFPKATDRSNALRILKGKFMALWGTNPEAIPEELFSEWFAGLGLEGILEEYRSTRASREFGGGHNGRNAKNRALAEIRSRFYRAADSGMTNLADAAISQASIRDAQSGDLFQTGLIFHDDHLTVNNRSGLRPGVGQAEN